MSASPNEGPKVYWYGPVDKIGSNLAALPRVLFITPTSILVCQPTGGVTRTVLIEKLAEVVLAPPTVVRMLVAQEPDLVVSTQSANDRSDLMEALLKSFQETCGDGSELPITETAHLVLPNASPSPINGTSQSGTQLPKWNGNNEGHADAQTTVASKYSPSSLPSARPFTTQSGIRNILSSLEDDPQQPQPSGNWSTPSGYGASATNGSAARHNAVHSLSTSSPLPPAFRRDSPPRDPTPRQGSPRLELSFDPVSSSQTPSIVSLQQQIEAQKNIIEKLQRDSANDSTAHNLRRELDQAKSLIADLQVALRSQENAFSEMVKASEALKTSETIRSSQEAQITALREEVQSLKRDTARHDQSENEWKRRVATLEEGHRNEIQAVRDAFAKYDDQVSTYVDQLKKEHDGTLRELLQQKDSLLVRQGELIARVEQLEGEKRNMQAQKSAVAGNVWRPHSPMYQYPTAAATNSEISSDELRAALMAKLNRYSNANHQQPTGASDAQSVPPTRDDHSQRQRTPPTKRTVSPASGRMRDRSIL